MDSDVGNFINMAVVNCMNTVSECSTNFLLANKLIIMNLDSKKRTAYSESAFSIIKENTATVSKDVDFLSVYLQGYLNGCRIHDSDTVSLIDSDEFGRYLDINTSHPVNRKPLHIYIKLAKTNEKLNFDIEAASENAVWWIFYFGDDNVTFEMKAI